MSHLFVRAVLGSALFLAVLCAGCVQPGGSNPDRPTALTLSPQSFELVLAGSEAETSRLVTATLTHESGATSEPERTSWTSSDADVATVDDDGLVTASGVGTAIITAVAVGPGLTATAAVTVLDSVTGLRLDPAGPVVELALTAPDNQQQIVGWYQWASPETPDSSAADLTWASADGSVATVDATGLVTAQGAGSTTVTAVSAAHAVSASIDVSVDDAPAALVISGTADLVELGPGSYDLQLAVGGTDHAAASSLSFAVRLDSGALTPLAASEIAGIPADTAGLTVVVGQTVDITATGAAQAQWTLSYPHPSGTLSAVLEITAVDPVVGLNILPQSATLDWSNSAPQEVEFEAFLELASGTHSPASGVIWSVGGAESAVVDSQGRLSLVPPGTTATETATVTAVHPADATWTDSALVQILNPVTALSVRESGVPVSADEPCALTLSMNVKPEAQLNGFLVHASGIQQTSSAVPVTWNLVADDGSLSLANADGYQAELVAEYGGSGTIAFRAEPGGVELRHLIDACVLNHDSRSMEVAAGRDFSMVVSRSGSLYTFGENFSGKLGDGTDEDRASPVNISLTGSAALVAAGAHHALATDAAGTLHIWGFNPARFGNGMVPQPYALPSAVVDIAAGAAHSLAVTADGRLFVWGSNAFGQLGRVDLVEAAVPVELDLPSPVVQVATKENSSFALTEAGQLFVWGRNSAGQLGNSSFADSPSPSLVTLGEPIVQVSAGGLHTAAVTRSGALYIWGSNVSSQLGFATDLSISTPTLLDLGKPVSYVAAGEWFTLALTRDGDLYAWGDNGAGQLGGGTFGDEQPTPVQVVEDSDFVHIAAGDNHSLAITAAGEVFTWGFNGLGQLGNGSNEPHVTPVSIGFLDP